MGACEIDNGGYGVVATDGSSQLAVECFEKSSILVRRVWTGTMQGYVILRERLSSRVPEPSSQMNLFIRPGKSLKRCSGGTLII